MPREADDEPDLDQDALAIVRLEADVDERAAVSALRPTALAEGPATWSRTDAIVDRHRTATSSPVMKRPLEEHG